jgi:hypothetical protein
VQLYSTQERRAFLLDSVHRQAFFFYYEVFFMETTQKAANQSATTENGKESAVSIFGQFATAEFWKTLFSMIVREALSTFIMSVGSTLVYYVRGKLSSDSQSVKSFVSNAGGIPPSTPQANPGAAFSGGFAPRPSYAPATQVAPYPQQPAGNQTYPGFL